MIAHGGYLDTDGKLLSFVRLNALNMKFLSNFFDWVVEKRFGSWHCLFKEYFQYEDHFNVIHSKFVKLRFLLDR